MSQVEKEFTYKAFTNREYEFRHSPFEQEFEFYKGTNIIKRFDAADEVGNN